MEPSRHPKRYRNSAESIKRALDKMAQDTRIAVDRMVGNIHGPGGLNQSLHQTQSKMSLAEIAAGKLKSAIGGLAAIGTITGLLFEASKASSELEQSFFQMSKTFGENSTAMIARARTMADQMSHYFSVQDIQYAFIKTADSMQRYGIQGQQYLDLVARATDVAAAKGLSLKESIDRIESAMRGEAEASEYLGLTLNDTYMKTIAFDGKLKEHWETMADTNKAYYRYIELLSQTEKYTGSAKEATATLGGAMSSLWNTLKDRVAPAMQKVNETLARYISLITKAMSMPTLDEVIASKRATASGGDPFGAISNRDRQTAGMDLLDLYRAKQAGKIGTTGMGIAPPAIATDPKKLLQQYKDVLEVEEDSFKASGRAKDWSAAKEGCILGREAEKCSGRLGRGQSHLSRIGRSHEQGRARARCFREEGCTRGEKSGG
ncbi:MAG: hypothetical protein AB9873_12175 [Syntrophobacteraceae bacterium]